ncbi:Major facilitator superfamily domain-containing protein 9 [Nymphon striatum]|nr:Major facilitator superfamily domain-containing protein 9 [Nymphon striatum]
MCLNVCYFEPLFIYKFQIQLLTPFCNRWDMFAVSMFIPMILIQTKSLGASPLTTGFIGSIYGCLQLISSPLIGSWSDSKGKKFVLCICLLMSALAYFITGLAYSLPMMICARIIIGIFKHTQTIGRAYLADITPENSEGKIFGQFMATSNMGFIVGPVIGGHLGNLPNGFFYVCTFTTFIFLTSFVLLYLAVPEISPKEKKCSKQIEMWKVFTHLSDINWSKQYDLMIGRFFFSFAVLVYRSNFSLLMNESLGLDSVMIGYIISYQGIISACSGFFVGKIEQFYKQKRARLLKHAMVLLILSLVGLTMAQDVYWIVPCLTLLCFSTSIIRVQYMELSVHRCEKDEVGAVIGVAQSITSISRMFSPLVAGITQQIGIYGPGTMGIISSVLGYMFTLVIPKFVK